MLHVNGARRWRTVPGSQEDEKGWEEEGNRGGRGWNQARQHCAAPIVNFLSAQMLVPGIKVLFAVPTHTCTRIHTRTCTHTLETRSSTGVLQKLACFSLCHFLHVAQTDVRPRSFPCPHSSQLSRTRTEDVIGGCRHRKEVCFLSLQSKHSKHSTSQDSTRKRRHVPQLIRSFISAIWCLYERLWDSLKGFVWCNLVQLPVIRAVRCVCV